MARLRPCCIGADGLLIVHQTSNSSFGSSLIFFPCGALKRLRELEIDVVRDFLQQQ
jgi:hypothetical protein